MNTSQLVAAVILKATGKVSALTPVDTKFIKAVAIANDLITQWENEKGVDWNSLYDPAFAIGTVSETDTFEFDNTEVRKISDASGDTLTIQHLDGSTTEYTFVRPEQLKIVDGNVCAQIGASIRFKKPFKTEDAQFGGTILIPVYTFAEKLKTNTQVPVDIPRWLVVMSAAEWVRNDITKQNQYGNLVNEANELMQRMIDDNNAQLTVVSRPWRAGR